MHRILRRKSFWLAIVYVLLLVASFFVRTSKPPILTAVGKNFVDVKVDKIPAARVAFLESGNREAPGLAVVMIHGSPGSAEAFYRSRLIEKLRTKPFGSVISKSRIP